MENIFVDTKPRTIINKNQVTSNRIVLSNLGKFLIGYVTAAFCWFPYLVIQSKRKILHKYDWRHPSSDARGLILSGREVKEIHFEMLLVNQKLNQLKQYSPFLRKIL